MDIHLSPLAGGWFIPYDERELLIHSSEFINIFRIMGAPFLAASGFAQAKLPGVAGTDLREQIVPPFAFGQKSGGGCAPALGSPSPVGRQVANLLRETVREFKHCKEGAHPPPFVWSAILPLVGADYRV